MQGDDQAKPEIESNTHDAGGKRLRPAVEVKNRASRIAGGQQGTHAQLRGAIPETLHDGAQSFGVGQDFMLVEANHLQSFRV